MPINVRHILMKLGALGSDGKQLRSVTREDLTDILNRNGGTAKFLDFRRLCFKDADLRGMKFHRARFDGCDLTGVKAFPLIKSHGHALDFYDSSTERILQEWKSGTLEEGTAVELTRFNGSSFAGAKLDDSHFEYAILSGARFNGARAYRANFFGGNFAKANVRFAEFMDVDLRNADFRKANLYGFRLESVFVDGINWGEKQIVSDETEGRWEDAILIYRMLARTYELAGLNDIAGEFRFRLQQANTGRLLQRVHSLANQDDSPGNARVWLCAIRNGGGRALQEWFRQVLLDWLFGFGEREWRVVRAIVIMLVFFSPIYFEYSHFQFNLDGYVEFFRTLLRAFYFSAASSFALGYGSWVGQQMGWVKYLGVVQSFVGTLLTALFLVTFVRRRTR